MLYVVYFEWDFTGVCFANEERAAELSKNCGYGVPVVQVPLFSQAATSNNQEAANDISSKASGTASGTATSGASLSSSEAALKDGDEILILMTGDDEHPGKDKLVAAYLTMEDAMLAASKNGAHIFAFEYRAD